MANVAKLPYMIAKRTDSIWWRFAHQLEGGFASFTTVPSARNYGNVYARSHPACEAGNPLALGCPTKHPVPSRRPMTHDQAASQGFSSHISFYSVLKASAAFNRDALLAGTRHATTTMAIMNADMEMNVTGSVAVI